MNPFRLFLLLGVAAAGCGPRDSEPTVAAPVTTAKVPAVDMRPPQYTGKDFTFSQGYWFTPVTDEPGYDRDRRFTLAMYDFKDRTLAEAVIRFTIFDTPRDLNELVDALAEGQAVQFAAKRDGTIAKWGRYEGRGVTLRGRDSRKAPVVVRVFAFTTAGRTVAVVELYPVGSRDGDQVFDAIRSTFEFTDPK